MSPRMRSASCCSSLFATSTCSPIMKTTFGLIFGLRGGRSTAWRWSSPATAALPAELWSSSAHGAAAARARRGRLLVAPAAGRSSCALIVRVFRRPRDPSRTLGAPRLLDVAGDLRDELGLALEGLLVADPAPEFDDEALPVEVAVEVEQERLDAALVASVVRVRPDRDGGAALAGGARVDAVRRHDEARIQGQVRGREAERAAARVARDDEAVDLRGPPQERGGALQLARPDEPPDGRRGDAFHQRDVARVEAELAQDAQVAVAAVAEAEALARDDDLGADRAEYPFGEVLRGPGRELVGELEHEHVLDVEPFDQLDPPLERRQQLDPVSEDLARVWVERDDGRCQARVDRGADHPPVSQVDAVEGAERDRARLPLELPGRARDAHASRAS